MTLVAAERRENPFLLRAGVALIALLGAAVVVFGLGMLFFGTAPAAPKSPFGVGISEAAASGSALGRWLLVQEGWFSRQMSQALLAARDHNGFAFGMVLLAFAYGIFHAAGPGHGKAVISAYLIANERALWRGIGLSAASALLQAFVAVALVLVAHFILRATAVGMTQLTGRVELISFVAIMLYGLVLTWRKARPVAARLAQEPEHRLPEHRLEAAHHHLHHEHSHGDHHDHAHHDHDHHHHDHDGHDCCGHHVPVELVQSQSFRWREAVPVVFAAGLRPCSGAILVLIFALAQGLVAAGLAAVFAMAVGVAITVSALAILAVFAKQTAVRLVGGENRMALLGVGVELVAAAFVAVIGFGLMSGYAMIAGG